MVREERRMRVESSTQGKLMELLLATSFMAHPYRNMIGWASEIERLRAKDAEAFYQKYYAPGNITMAVVGDVKAAEIKRLAEKYFASDTCSSACRRRSPPWSRSRKVRNARCWKRTASHFS